MDRDYLPHDIYELGWRIYEYSDKWLFNEEMVRVGRDLRIGVYKNDEELGLLKGYATGSDLEQTVRDAVSTAS